MTNPSFKFTREVSTAYSDLEKDLGEEQAIMRLIGTTCEIIKAHSKTAKHDNLIQMFRFNLVTGSND